MGSKLSHELIDLGFFSALGTSEHPGGMKGEGVYVKRRSPNTYDSNNGVIVIYDENGRPWIIRDYNDLILGNRILKVIHEHDLKRGAYVPHSNDGGHFVDKVLPNLKVLSNL